MVGKTTGTLVQIRTVATVTTVFTATQSQWKEGWKEGRKKGKEGWKERKKREGKKVHSRLSMTKQ